MNRFLAYGSSIVLAVALSYGGIVLYRGHPPTRWGPRTPHGLRVAVAAKDQAYVRILGKPQAQSANANGVLVNSLGQSVTGGRGSTKTCATGATFDAAQIIPRGDTPDGVSPWGTYADVTAAPVITSNYAASPTGSMDAVRVQFPAVAGSAQSSLVYQSPVLPAAGPYTFSMSVRGNGTSGTIYLAFQGASSFEPCTFGPSSFTRCSVTSTQGAGGTNIEFGANSVAPISTPAMSAADVIVWGAKVEAVRLPGSTNNLASWNQTSAIPTGNAGTAPDGTATATRITAQAGAGFHGINKSAASGDTSLSNNLFSVYLRQGTVRYAATWWSNTGQGLLLDLQNGTILQTGGGQTGTITDAGNGWWLVTQRGGSNLTNDAPLIMAYDGSNGFAAAAVTWTAAGTESVYAWGARLDFDSRGGAYAPGNNQLYKDVPSQAPCVEPNGLRWDRESTNLASNSDAFSSASWTPIGATNAVVANVAMDPFGVSNGDELDLPAVSSGFSDLNQPFSTSSAGVNTASVFARGKTGPGTFYVALLDGTSSTWASTPCSYTASTWTRCEVSKVLTAGNSYFVIGVDLRAPTQTAQPAQSFYLSRAQLEPQSYAGPPIFTGASAVGRPYDYNVSLTSDVIPVTSSSGCMSMCIRPFVPGGVLPAESTNAAYNLYRREGGMTALLNGVGDPAMYSSDGIQSWKVDAALQQGVRKCYSAEWTPTSRTMRNWWSGIASTYNVGLGNAFTTMSPCGGLTQGWVDNIAIGTSPSACGNPQSTQVASIDALGDSITQGTGLTGITTPYPVKLGQNLGATYFVENSGVGGNTSANILARWSSQNTGTGDGAIATSGYRYLSLLDGVNDVLTGVASSTTIANVTAILDDALARGMKVVSMTVTPCNGYSGCDATAQAKIPVINAALVSYATAHSASVRLVDTNALLRDSSDPSKVSATYDSGDHLHPNQAGMDAIASAVAAVLPF